MTTEQRSKTILITGATGGLGSALALACAERGARVILLDRKRKALEALCDRIEERGAPAPGYVDLDLGSLGPDGVEELVSSLVEAYGGLDGVVHCAARFDGLRTLDQIAPQDWLMDLQVNLNVAWLLTMRCLATLKDRRGRIVFLRDDEARGKAYWGAYGVSKAAIDGLVGTLAEELDGTGCAVTAIDPGPLRTDLRSAAYVAEDPATVPDPSTATEGIVDFLLGEAAGPAHAS